MYTIHLPLLIALSLVPSTFSSPLPASHTEHDSARTTILPITHRSNLLSHPILSARTDDYIPIFDSTAAELVRQEIQAVKNKYANAARYLAGVQVAEADVSFEQPSGTLPIEAAHSTATSGLFSSTTSMAISPLATSTSVSMPVASTATLTSASGGASSPSQAASSAASSASASAGDSEGGIFSFQGAPLFAPVIGTHTSVDPAYQPLQSTAALLASSTPLGTAIAAVVPKVPAPKIDIAARSRNTGSPVVPLTDYISGSLDVLYYGGISIGTPAQTLTVDFDTGSADLWLPVGCSNCQSQQFDSSRSSTYRPTGQSFSVEYGSGSVSGQLARETVGLANTQVTGQYFGAVSSESSDFTSNPNSGVLGMGFSSISSSNQPTYFENLISTKSVANPLFGFHLARKQAQGSQLCIGCYDSSKFTGAISWIPVISQTYWSISMTSFSANGGRSNALSQSLIGAVDTGTTLIYVPSAVADAFYAQIPGSSKADQYGAGFYQFPCRGSANVVLGFNGKSFSLNPVDFNLGRTGSGSSMCIGAVLAVGDGFPSNLAIVGDAFLKSWYSIYDYSNNVRVGFASSVNNNSINRDGTDIHPDAAPGPLVPPSGLSVLPTPLAAAHLAAFLDRGKGKTVMLTGAGVSVDSGIRAYRGKEGTYSNPNYKPIMYHQLVEDSDKGDMFRRRYWARSFLGYPPVRDAQPNPTHIYIAALQHLGLAPRLITQNVDNLHRKAYGLLSKSYDQSHILELHGTLAKVHCLKHRHEQSRDIYQESIARLNPVWDQEAKEAEQTGRRPRTNPDGDVELHGVDYRSFSVPPCAKCEEEKEATSMVKPNVVFFGETIRPQVRDESLDLISDSSSLLIIGTSLATYSAYRLVKLAKEQKKPVLMITTGPTRADPFVGEGFEKMDRVAGDVLGKYLDEVVKTSTGKEVEDVKRYLHTGVVKQPPEVEGPRAEG